MEQMVMDPMAGLAILVIGFIIYGTCAYLVLNYVWPYIRYNNYLQSYKIGRLVKHAAEKNIKFIFQKKPKRDELQEIDDVFDEELKKPKEIEEIESAYDSKEFK